MYGNTTILGRPARWPACQHGRVPRASGFPLPTTKGRLLVAAPPLGDANFDRSVVYVLEHNEGGALGLVLNRPSDEVTVELPGWSDLAAPPQRIFRGGPVETQALLALGRVIEDGRARADAVDLEVDPATVEPRPDVVRIFHGYSGWGAQQLDGELDLGAWIVVPAEIDDVFTADPDGLWRRVLTRQPGRTAWLADYPADVLTN